MLSPEIIISVRKSVKRLYDSKRYDSRRKRPKFLKKTCIKCGETDLLKFTLLKTGKLHSWCKDCYRAYGAVKAKKYYPNRRNYILNWQRANKELCAARSKRYTVNNPQKVKATQRIYRRSAKGKINTAINDSNRRSNYTGTFSAGQWVELKNRYGNMCLRCKSTEPSIKLTVDHVIPISKGGTNTIDNLQPLCRSCNSKKATSVIDYRQNFYA